jgi:hypothetical protein
MGNKSGKVGSSKETTVSNNRRLSLFYEVILNDLLFKELKDFLNETIIGTNCLLNVSRHFQHLKKANFHWSLDRQYSWNYYNSSQYRERLSLLMNTKSQLSLELIGYHEVVDVKILKDVYYLGLNRCINIEDVTALSRAHVVKLRECYKIVDVSPLKDVYDLDLSCCDFIDVSSLSRVKKLNLSLCQNLVDVSALGRVRELTLHHCNNLIDVSALRGVYELDLSDCPGVVEVSALCNVRDLNLSNCDNVVNVSELGRVHTLNLSNCRGVVNVSALGNVVNLDLSCCDSVIDVRYYTYIDVYIYRKYVFVNICIYIYI